MLFPVSWAFRQVEDWLESAYNERHSKERKNEQWNYNLIFIIRNAFEESIKRVWFYDLINYDPAKLRSPIFIQTRARIGFEFIVATQTDGDWWGDFMRSSFKLSLSIIRLKVILWPAAADVVLAYTRDYSIFDASPFSLA